MAVPHKGAKSYSPFRRERAAAEADAAQQPLPGTEQDNFGALVVGGRRRDGRSPEECRPAFVKLGTVSQASGSAYVEFGRTKVVVSVFGPREAVRGTGPAGPSSEGGRLSVHVTVAPFARVKRTERGNQSSAEEQELAGVLLAALSPAVQRHTFPKATLDIAALVLEAGGSEAAVLVQCASAALADASVPLFDLVSCATVMVWRNQLLLDPSDEEEIAEEGRITLALMPTASLVTHLTFSGDLHAQQLQEAVELATGGCLKLDEMVRSAVREEIEAAEEE